MKQVGEIRCDLGWSRRPAIPPHPNIHTDEDFAREHGFPEVIMPGIVVLAKVYETIAAALVPDDPGAAFSGATYSDVARRPIRVSAQLAVLVDEEAGPDGARAFQVRDERDEMVIVGTVRLGDR